MGLSNLLFIIIITILPYILLASTIIDHETMLKKLCTGIEPETSCLSNLRSELLSITTHSEPPPPQPETELKNSVLSAALKHTMNEAKAAIEMITRFSGLSGGSYREQLAIEDCKELLDFSVSELAWSLAKMRLIRRGSVPSRDHAEFESDLKAWLSAALSNQDTCLEGFEGTDRRVERFIRASLRQVTQLIGNVLALYVELHTLPFKPPREYHNSTGDHGGEYFPAWMTEEEREMVAAGGGVAADVVVAGDGSGDYRTITEAVNAAPSYGKRRYVIYVKRGVYKENIDMKRKKTNIMFVGDGIGHTVVTGDRNFMQGWTTFRTATVAVSGQGFIGRDMTFRNTAGPEKHQAVALRVDSDRSAFFRCSFEGHQDTLYAHSLRQFYRDCDVSGTIDFLFGNGAAVLQNCRIFTRDPLPLQKVTIAAQGRKSPHQSTGFTIQDSFVFATRPTYLGRPWKEFSRTVYLNTYMSALVQPRGWLEWYGDFALGTLWYGEYRNYGPGAGLSARVSWPGYHVIKDAATASFFTVGRFIDGLSWLPATGVKFTAGLKS